MSDKREESVTANALALEIFKDNLKLHEQIDYMQRERECLREVIVEAADNDTWKRYAGKALDLILHGCRPL